MKAPFVKKNYVIFLVGIGLLVLGYLLMMGGGSEDLNTFNPAIFDFQRITLSPIICLAGFVTIIVSIMWRPKTS